MSENSKGKGLKGEAELVVDRLSDLPDSVLSHILSFLPTEPKLVETSLVSKRWRNLWTWVHTLHFEEWWCECDSIPTDDGEVRMIQFAQFVYRVLMSIKGPIQNMGLTCEFSSADVNEPAIIDWIIAATDRGVRCLSLFFRWEKISLPFSLFNSKTLVHLELLYIAISDLDVPSAPFFPSLKKLRIVEAWFDPPETLNKLIAGCSALEQLCVDLGYTVSLNISSSTLKELELYNNQHGLSVYGNKIALVVPVLELLKMNCLQREFLVEAQLSSLVKVDICLFNNHVVNDDICRDSFERFLQLISSVKILRLNCCFKKPLTTPVNAEFNNLTELKILSPFFEWTLVRNLMERSINLKSLTLEKKNPDTDQVLWNEPQDVPHCLLSSLRIVSIAGYGIEDELDIVKYVLENAQVLERMEIHCLGHKDDSNLQLHILQKVAMIEGASRCQISFA